jgi:hypothetical protein
MNADDEKLLGMIFILYPLAFMVAAIITCEIAVRIVRKLTGNKGFWA